MNRFVILVITILLITGCFLHKKNKIDYQFCGTGKFSEKSEIIKNVLINTSNKKEAHIYGHIYAEEIPLSYSNLVFLGQDSRGSSADSLGYYSVTLLPDTYNFTINFPGLAPLKEKLIISSGEIREIDINMSAH